MAGKFISGALVLATMLFLGCSSSPSVSEAETATTHALAPRRVLAYADSSITERPTADGYYHLNTNITVEVNGKPMTYGHSSIPIIRENGHYKADASALAAAITETEAFHNMGKALKNSKNTVDSWQIH